MIFKTMVYSWFTNSSIFLQQEKKLRFLAMYKVKTMIEKQ